MGLRDWLRRETARIRDDWNNLSTRTEAKIGVSISRRAVLETLQSTLYGLTLVAWGWMLGTAHLAEILYDKKCYVDPGKPYGGGHYIRECGQTIATTSQPLVYAGLVAMVATGVLGWLVGYLWLGDSDE